MSFLAPLTKLLRLSALLVVTSGCASRTQEPTTSPAETETEAVAETEVDSSPTKPPPKTLRVAGIVRVPNADLDFYARLEAVEGGAYRGELNIPKQLGKQLPLSNVAVSGDELSFTLAAAGATWSATIGEDGTLACKFVQQGAEFPCEMKQLDAQQWAEATTVVRRQTPKAPFPYDVVEVEYDNEAGPSHLAGTLTIPPGDGPHPVALLITGSGPQDRNSSIADHQPFWVLADHLSRNGIAALRVDDRGVGKSTGAKPDDTSMDFASDVEAGIAFLKARPRIDAKRIGLIGHSEGGMIAPMVAAKTKDVAFVVLMAGPGVPGLEVIVAQVGAVLAAGGASPAVVDHAKAKQRKALETILATPNDQEAVKKVRELLGAADESAEAQLKSMLTPWFRFFLKHDPARILAKVRCPILVLNGEKDTQVVAEQNVPAIQKALRRGRNRKVTVHRFPDLNHLFQTARTGSVIEYQTLQETLDPEVLETISKWIGATVGVTR